MIAQLWIGLVNRLLAREDWARERLLPFCGRTLRIQARSGRGFTVTVDARGFVAAADEAGGAGAAPDAAGGTGATPDAAGGTRAAPIADATVDFGDLLRATLGPRGDEGLTVEGDAELAQAISFVAAHLRWDAEEDLARVFGNVAARRIMRTAQSARALQRDSMERLADNVGEYLTEETRWLVGQTSLRAFAMDVETLNASLDRLSSRLDAVESRRRC